MHADELAFRRAIIADPGCDAPRLVMADWLDEHGDSDRSAFIRVQCELAQHPNEKRCHDKATADGQQCLDCWEDEELRRREQVLRAQIPVWGFLRAEESRFGGDGIKWEFTRGFISHVTLTMAAFMGERCGRCIGVGKRGEADGPRICPHCHGSGSTTGVAAELFRLEPVTNVTFSDKRPLMDDARGGPYWCWWDEFWQRQGGGGNTDPQSDIPGDIYRLIKGQEGSVRQLFASEAAAIEALSRAACEWGMTGAEVACNG